VYGTGNPNADVMVIGEAPGADEDEQGLPFVGRAGKLLTDILKAINFSREDIYICNILKCRPPDNRNPNPEEILKCEPYLIKQIELIKPKLILCVGTFAGQTMLRVKEPLGKMRGKFYNITFGNTEVKVMVTYHPAALLRNPNWKKPTWEDVQLFRSEYDKEKK
jgi:DNA polymerase